MSVQLEQVWSYKDPSHRSAHIPITVPSGLSDTLLVAFSCSYYSKYVEDFAIDGTPFTEFSPVYSVYDILRANVEYYKNVSSGNHTWETIWYADDAVGVAALCLFSGVNQTTPFGTSEYDGLADDEVTISPTTVLGDYCLGMFARRINPAETISLGTDLTQLLDLSSADGSSGYNNRMILAGKNPGYSNPEALVLTSNQSNATLSFGIAIHPTTVDNISSSSQCVILT